MKPILWLFMWRGCCRFLKYVMNLTVALWVLNSTESVHLGQNKSWWNALFLPDAWIVSPTSFLLVYRNKMLNIKNIFAKNFIHDHPPLLHTHLQADELHCSFNVCPMLDVCLQLLPPRFPNQNAKHQEHAHQELYSRSSPSVSNAPPWISRLNERWQENGFFEQPFALDQVLYIWMLCTLMNGM